MLYLTLELISKIKYAVCKSDGGSPCFFGRGFGKGKSLCLFCLFLGLWVELKLDFSGIWDLTNGIFKVWSNTTLRLVLLCTHVSSFLNCGWTCRKLLTRTWPPNNLQIQRMKEKYLSLFLFHFFWASFWDFLSQKCIYENHVMCQITSRTLVWVV